MIGGRGESVRRIGAYAALGLVAAASFGASSSQATRAVTKTKLDSSWDEFMAGQVSPRAASRSTDEILALRWTGTYGHVGADAPQITPIPPVMS